MRTMPIVVVESPFHGATTEEKIRNLRYARAAVRDCLLRGESPFASHLLYTQEGILNDDVDGDRALGMEAGWAFLSVAEKVVVYTDLGLSRGMEAGISRAIALGHQVEYRKIPDVSG